MQNSMVVLILVILEWKYDFWINFDQKIKIFSLSWNLVRRVNRIWKLQWWFSLFPFSAYSLFGQIWSKRIKIVSLGLHLVPRLKRICRIQWWCSLFLFKTANIAFGQIPSKKIKIVSLSWNLILRLIRICRI